MITGFLCEESLVRSSVTDAQVPPSSLLSYRPCSVEERSSQLSAIPSRTFTWRIPAKSSEAMMKLYNGRRTDKSDLADLKRTAQFIQCCWSSPGSSSNFLSPTVCSKTSDKVVSPAVTLMSPDSRSVCIPSRRASCRISAALPRAIISSSIPSLIRRASKIPVRPLNPDSLHF